MPNDLNEIKTTLQELVMTLQSYLVSSRDSDPEKMVMTESVAVSLDKIAKAVPQMKQVNSSAEFITNFLASIKGDPGEPGEAGKTPEKGVDYFTESELDEIVSRIRDLIPTPEDGKTPEKGVDYMTAEEVDSFIREVVSRIPKPKDGDPGKDAVLNYEEIATKLLPLLPKPKEVKQITPDTAQDIVKKLRSLKEGEKLSLDDLKDVPDFAAMFNRVKNQPVQDPGIAIEGSGEEIASLIRRINFTGSGVTVSKVGDRVVVQISGGGGAVNIRAQESLSDQTIDGVNTVFTLDYEPVEFTLQLFLNEALVSPSRYTLLGNEITFNSAPDASYSGLPFDAFYERTP
jgi:archaellum component FlaC